MNVPSPRLADPRIVPAGLPPRRALWAVIQGSFVAALGGLLFGFDTAVISGTTEALKVSIQFGFESPGVHGGDRSGRHRDRVDDGGQTRRPLGPQEDPCASSRRCTLFRRWAAPVAPTLGDLIGGSVDRGAGNRGRLGGRSDVYRGDFSAGSGEGRLVAISQLNIVIGILLSYLSNYLIVTFVHTAANWRLMLGIVALPSVLFFVSGFFSSSKVPAGSFKSEGSRKRESGAQAAERAEDRGGIGGHPPIDDWMLRRR